MVVETTYFVGGLDKVIRAKLLALKDFSHKSGYIAAEAHADMALEILSSLNHKALPVADVTEFRKALILEFYKRHDIDLDPLDQLGSELVVRDAYISVRVEQLVTEYHKRLWACLKLTIRAIVPVLAGVPVVSLFSNP